MNRTPDPQTEWLREGLQTILTRYVQARKQEQFEASHPLRTVARQLQADLGASPAIRDQSQLRVGWSFGRGGWARIPWIAVLDERVTRTTTSGVYVIYLFREDMSGIYATLNQGIAKETQQLGATAARFAIRERTVQMRRLVGNIEDAGFTLSNDIDLHTDHVVGKEYQHGTVAYRLYETSAIPTTGVLLSDLKTLLQAYGVIVESRR
jgi:hypothetical protein